VHVHGLSSNIDLDSVRVSGISESVRVFDVVCSHKQSHYPEDGDPLEAIRLLWAKKVYLEQLRKYVTISLFHYYWFSTLAETALERPT
jgi:hypothetical protein